MDSPLTELPVYVQISSALASAGIKNRNAIMKTRFIVDISKSPFLKSTPLGSGHEGYTLLALFDT